MAYFKHLGHMGQIIPAQCPWNPSKIFMNMTTALIINVLETGLIIVIYLKLDCIEIAGEVANNKSTTGWLK